MIIGKKESATGVAFALFVAIFTNYSSIERLFDMDMQRIYSAKVIMPLLFSLMWFCVVSMVYYLLYVVLFNLFHQKKHSFWIVLSIVTSSLLLHYIFIELYPNVRDAVVLGRLPIRRPQHPMDMRGFNSIIFKQVLISVLNLLFVYIQRLLYQNQEIERRNEQLQLENIKSQHGALIQQVNPHFFFNSLGSLRYIILQNKRESAVEFLDNLIAIFRKTLKLSHNTLHTLHEELELTTSYIHIIERRFEGKIFVTFDIAPTYELYMLSPLSLLTLIENVVKHNTVSARQPIEVRIYTNSNNEIVVENNVVPKFEAVESNGIGLINLNKQYELLTGRGVVVTADENHFCVKLPLIQETL